MPLTDCQHFSFSEKQATMIAKYTSKWRAYEEKWKNQPLAKEVENIKKQAFDIDMECKYIILVALISNLQIRVRSWV